MPITVLFCIAIASTALMPPRAALAAEAGSPTEAPPMPGSVAPADGPEPGPAAADGAAPLAGAGAPADSGASPPAYGVAGKPATDRPPDFATPGHHFIQGATALRLILQHRPLSVPNTHVNSWTAAINPTLGTFITELLFVRLGIGVGYAADAYSVTQISGGSSWALSAQPGVGLHLRLGRDLSLMPAVFGQYTWQRQVQPVVGGGPALTVKTHSLSVGAELPLVLHVVRHLSLTLGPVFNQGLVNRDDSGESAATDTAVGVLGGLLGWW